MNVTDMLEAAAAPVWVVDVLDLPADWWPRPGAMLPLDPGRVLTLYGPAVPPWERARRLLEEP